MTSLIERLRADALVVRKAAMQDGDPQAKFVAKTTATLFSTLIGEADKVGKGKGGRESTDFEVVGVIERFLTNANDNHAIHIARAEPDVKRIAELVIEKEVLAKYMPEPLVQLTDEELNAEVASIVAALPERTMKQMGVVMGALKKNFEGRYNGDAAGKIVRAALA